MTCSVEGCDLPRKCAQMCQKHYIRWYKYGDPLFLLRRPNGTGCIDKTGYVVYGVGSRKVHGHVLVAERALGRRLPKGSLVHHVDEDRANNASSNLVICESTAYHSLLHLRLAALRACGHAAWRKCYLCGVYAAPADLYVSRRHVYHRACAAAYQRERSRRAA